MIHTVVTDSLACNYRTGRQFVACVGTTFLGLAALGLPLYLNLAQVAVVDRNSGATSIGLPLLYTVTFSAAGVIALIMAFFTWGSYLFESVVIINGRLTYTDALNRVRLVANVADVVPYTYEERPFYKAPSAAVCRVNFSKFELNTLRGKLQWTSLISNAVDLSELIETAATPRGEAPLGQGDFTD